MVYKSYRICAIRAHILAPISETFVMHFTVNERNDVRFWSFFMELG